MCNEKKKLNFECYGKTVNEHREHRKEIRKSILKESAATQFILDKFNGTKETSIFFRELDEAFLLNQVVHVNDRIKVLKLSRCGKELRFQTSILAGGRFSWHYHEDCSEIVTVVKGTYYDAYSGKSHTVGEEVVYLSGVRHTPSALEDTILHVKIIKDE